MEPAPGIEPEQLGVAFLRLLESRGLQDLGRGDATLLEFLVASDGGQATEGDREAVVSWLHARAEVSDFGVGPLVDVDDAVA